MAVVTGAARGQGRSHAVALAAKGFDIIALDSSIDVASIRRPVATAEDLAHTAVLVRKAGARVCTVVADVRDPSAIRDGINSGIDEVGEIDVVVTAGAQTGICGDEPFDHELFRDILDVNLRGVWHTMAATVPSIIRNGRGGSVVLVNPMQASLGRSGDDGSTAAFAAAVSRHGVDGLVRSASLAYAGYGIRVNAVDPSGVTTSTISHKSAESVYEIATDSAMMAENLRPVPPVDPVDITQAVLFLVSDNARFTNGATLPVHTGFSAKLRATTP
ncbi:SDR family oxidoreductase [Mycobacterium sp. 29Ha]|uniref:SDR family oxidoreductase n=1 Tax=Mycobacterium sp. 29Ha TaxID=2939268 RepID=UPI0029392F05|nr:SDR family oxidoreductase [Mycobacterium sp. 29Ha]MDV3136496.1 SDR family oxidoreductase [Mycobacterium sp. 29Ha]